MLVAAAVDGLVRSPTPATLNNVAFAGLHIAVLLVGVWPALVGMRSAAPSAREQEVRRAAA